MTDTTIGAPSESPVGDDGDKFQAKDHLGKLVMFAGLQKREVTTDFGDSIVADVSLVAVLDADGGPVIFSSQWIFGASLAPTLYKSPSDVVVGILGQGEAKPGKNAPWKLLDADGPQMEAARSWYAKFVSKSGSEYFYAPDEAPF